MSWPNELSLEFIMLYKQEPVLWNLKYPNAKNRTAVTEAWNRIRSALNVDISITDLKKKKESLMTSYRSNVKKKLDSDGKYNIQWFGFDLMDSFLADIYSPNEKSDDSKLFNDTTDDHQYVSNTNNTISNTVEYTPKKVVYLKRKPEQIHKPVRTIPDGEQDECELYTRLLTNKLRRLDEHQRDLAMHEIDNIMFRAKMQSLNAQSQSYTTSTMPRKTKSPLFIVSQERPYDDDESIQYLEEDPMEELND